MVTISKNDVLFFGQYKNKTIEYIMNVNPEYLLYLCNTDGTHFKMTKELEKEVIVKANNKLLNKF